MARLAAAALLILGLKCRLIASYGSPFPAWDQWQAEGDRLIRPWLAGQLTWAELLAPHNEHRILLTRLLVLLLFQVNQRWDALVEMTASAVLHTGFAVVLGAILLRRVGREQRGWLLGALVLLFGLPFGWENTLNGFQSQFYFLLLTSTLAVWGLAGDHRGSGWPRLVGWGGAVLACFSMGSGALASLTVAVCVGFRMVTIPRRRTRGAVATLAGSAVLFVGGYLLAKPPGRDHENPFASRSVGEFLGAFGNVLGWPNEVAPVMAVLAFLPLGCLAWLWVKRRHDPVAPEPGRSGVTGWERHPESFLLPMGLWCLLQAAALAWARGNYHGLARDGLWTSRYLDLASIGVLLNFACLLHLVPAFLRSPAAATRQNRIRGLALMALWPVTVLFGFAGVTHLNLQNDLPYQANLNVRGAEVLSVLLTNGDAGVLTEKSSADVRCEDLALLQRLLTGEAPLRAVLLPGENGAQGWLSALTRKFLGWNAYLIAAGVVGWAGLAGWNLLVNPGRRRGGAGVEAGGNVAAPGD